MPSVLGNGVLLGVALAGAQYTGGAVFSQRSDPDEDKFVTKEEVRRRFRRPVNEMINEIGEGRGNSSLLSWALYTYSPSYISRPYANRISTGIYGPGYDERRKNRLKEAYGIDVPEPMYKSS
jgi:hypothetical protein